MMPFWFWNDTLDEAELLRQIDSFERNGIGGFVLHPRVGLPRDTGWMSERLLHCMGVAIDDAARRGMTVILYDEGMYPSGASSGQVVAENPAFACRGFVPMPGDATDLPAGWHRVACVPRIDGFLLTVIDRPLDSWIRGLHYTGDDNRRSASDWTARDTPETRPPAADLLNPDSVACFIRLVYQRYYERFGRHFGTTIPAIFTDEPMVMGRGWPGDARPGTTGILEHVSRVLGYDFTPHLPALWHDEEPDAAVHRAAYRRAILHRLEDTYYRPLHDWCETHGVALTGHPESPMEIGHLRHFHWPGQDVIWREVMPGEGAVTGRQSAQAKCAASAAAHAGRERNLNEFMGAFGHDVPLSLYRFIAGWLLVRGCNLLVPHAYFYSVRGPRIDECPPQLGPHSPWWDTPELRAFHDAVRRLCWVNCNSQPAVHVAVLGHSDRLPLDCARTLMEHQIDFHYLEDRLLTGGETGVTGEGVAAADCRYDVVVVEPGWMTDEARACLAPLIAAGRCVEHAADVVGFIAHVLQWTPPVVTTDAPQPWLRARRVEKDGRSWVLLFNDGTEAIRTTVDLGTPAPGNSAWQAVDPATAGTTPLPGTRTAIDLPSGQWRLFSGPAC